MFHGRRRLLVQHLVFSAHVVSFVLLSSLPLMPALWLIQAGRSAGFTILLAVTLWQFAYLTIAIRRFYFADDTASPWRTLSAVAAALFIYLLNSAFLTGVQMPGAAVALRRL